jgi:hypothetical protein
MRDRSTSSLEESRNEPLDRSSSRGALERPTIIETIGHRPAKVSPFLQRCFGSSGLRRIAARHHPNGLSRRMLLWLSYTLHVDFAASQLKP